MTLLFGRIIFFSKINQEILVKGLNSIKHAKMYQYSTDFVLHNAHYIHFERKKIIIALSFLVVTTFSQKKEKKIFAKSLCVNGSCNTKRTRFPAKRHFCCKKKDSSDENYSMQKLGNIFLKQACN